MTTPLSAPGWSFGRPGQGPLVEWQTHYRLQDGVITDALGSRLTSEIADLIDVAVAVFVTDRLQRRRPPGATDDGTYWERRLPLEVAVRRPDTWNEPSVYRLLHELLHWLTDDEWQITFIGGGPRLPRHSETQGALFERPLAEPASAGLLSGGLDSLLGAAADLQGAGELLLVSTSTHNKLGNRQHKIATTLAAIGPRRVRWLGVPVNLTAEGRTLGEGSEEPSQRSRAFVFLALGAAAAICGNCDELRVYENGPGALNLALTAGQRGAMNTRAMRPETLSMMSRLVSAVTGVTFAMVNPNAWSTKAEMCARASRELDHAIAGCRSCDTALIGRRPKDAPCGRCTSCVLRRQALLAAGRHDLDRLDVQMMRGDSFRAHIPGQTERSLRLMIGQVHQLSSCLAADDPWASLIRRWPDLAGARMAQGVPPAMFLDLFQRYCGEWHRLGLPAIDRLLAA